MAEKAREARLSDLLELEELHQGAASADRAKALKQQLSKLMAAWNDDHPDKKVKNGDVILSVNGRKNDEEALYAAMEAKGSISLVVQRSVARAS